VSAKLPETLCDLLSAPQATVQRSRETPPVVVGVDLSLTATGLAWSDGTTCTYGRAGLTTLVRKVKGFEVVVSLDERAAALDQLADELYALIVYRPAGHEHVLPDLIVIESLLSQGRGGISTEKAHVWWRVVSRLTAAGFPVLEASVNTGKLYAFGIGDANKREVVASVQKRFPAWDIRKIGAKGKRLNSLDDNQADAVTFMAIGRDLLGWPVVELPAQHRKALDKLTLPTGVTRRDA
jgi:crossover junction endodeoxyribonuclease RuvC